MLSISLNNFNKEQLKAIKQGNKHCLVLAGAGSGKTRVLVARLAYLLKLGEYNCSDYNVLVVTFTRKVDKNIEDINDIMFNNNELFYPIIKGEKQDIVNALLEYEKIPKNLMQDIKYIQSRI